MSSATISQFISKSVVEPREEGNGIVLIRDTIETSGLALLYTLLQHHPTSGWLFLSGRSIRHYQAVALKMGVSFKHELVQINTRSVASILEHLPSTAVPVIVLDGLDDLSSDTTRDEYMALVRTLHSIAKHLVVLVHDDVLESGVDRALLPWLQHQARLDIAVKPLVSGWAEGVDGMVEIANHSTGSRDSFLYQAQEKTVAFRNPGIA
ncbi:hypothetical protein HDU91_006809 [Kappamyces sp. JEL0680]|nr:hypothetical protein HDU91_006809 [Kappamyces sp. JEL0680]